MKSLKNWIVAVLAIAVIAGGYYFWRIYDGSGLPAGIVGGNGRIEATEIDISTKTAGRIKDVLVDEGAFVTAGQVLAVMDTQQLEAQRKQVEASLERAKIGIDTAKSLLSQREAERDAVAAAVPADLLALYERLAAKSGGVGAAMLRHGRCSGCQLEANGADLARYKAAAEDEVLRCEECGRILVRTAESGL